MKAKNSSTSSNDRAETAAMNPQLHPTLPRGLRVTALKQGDRPHYRSARAAHLMVETLRLGGYVMMVRIANLGGRLVIDVAVDDSAPNCWADDVAYMFRDIFEFAAPAQVQANPCPVGHVVEVTAAASERDPLLELGILDGLDRSSDRPEPHRFTPTPVPIPDNAEDLLRELLSVPGAAIIYLAQAANELERSMASDQLAQGWAGSMQQLQGYNASSIRLRVFFVAPERIPDRLKAELRTIAVHVDFHELSRDEWTVVQAPRASHLAGSVVPLGVALSLIRLPAAGHGPFPGISTIKEPSARIPLDPAPGQPKGAAIRLGSAITGDGVAASVDISIQDLATHLHIIGQPGSGKTTLLVNLEAALAAQGIGFVSFSSHADLRERVLKEVDRDAGYRLWSVDHGDRNQVVPLNPLAEEDDDQFAQNVEAVTDALKEYIDPRGEGMYGERAAGSFMLVAEVCRKLGPVSIPMVTSILSRQDLCKLLALRAESTDPTGATRIRQELAELAGTDSRDMFSWLASRYTIIQGSPLLMRIIGTGANSVDMTQVMDSSEGLLVNLGGAELGVRASQFLLAMWLIQVRASMLRRRHPEKPFVLILDEAHAAAFGPLASLLDEARKFGVYIVIAHQRIGQLSGHLADALEADTGSFIALRCGPKDAVRAGARLSGWPVTDLTRMPTFQGAAVVSRDGVPTEPFSLFVDPPAVRSAAEETRRQAWVVEAVQNSNASLSLPYAHLEPVNPGNIQEVLDRPIRKAREARLAALKQPSSKAQEQSCQPDSGLGGYRRRMEEETTALYSNASPTLNVKGHRFLPGGGRETCPVTAM